MTGRRLAIIPRFARLLAAATVVMALSVSASGAVPESLEIGLTTDRAVIGASRVAAGAADAPTVALVGGLGGEDASSRSVREAAEAYAARRDAERPFALVAIPLANPERRPLVFPPTGPAYRENSESHALWRWLGLAAPDFVLVVGSDDADLTGSLSTTDVAGVAPIPARRADAGVTARTDSAVAPGADSATTRAGSAATLIGAVPATLPASPARAEIETRLARTPLDLANALAPIYSQTFDTPIYIDGMGLIAHLELGHLELVERVVAPYVDGTRDSLEGRFGVSTLVLAGHLVFAELAERTGDPRYLERARAAADLAFDENGEMLEAVPGHGEMSDAIFMGASILAAVGDLTGERRYFDMAVRQIDFMNALVRRDDGLYRHSPLTDAAWGRGNGFAAIGYALTLSKLPPEHPAFARLLAEYGALMTTLQRWQNADGTWRQVVDEPGAYHETSSTAIIGFSMQRGLNRGWLEPAEFGPTVAAAWRGLLTRTGSDGSFIDVSESTNKQPSLEAYLMREALAGRDQRTGSFAMLFAVERAGL